MTTYDLSAALAGVPRAQRRLEETLATLTEGEARAASALPGWTRGHVLTHIARNGEAMIRMVDGVLRGTPAEQYPGGVEARNAAIEAGAGRPAPELVADVAAVNAAVEEALDGMTPAAWGGTVVWRDGTVHPATRCPWARWQEVEIHHADLRLDRYTTADWPAEFVASQLPPELSTLAERLPAGTAVELAGATYGDGPDVTAVDGPDHAVLAWLVGRPRLAAPFLTTSTGTLPELAFWR